MHDLPGLKQELMSQIKKFKKIIFTKWRLLCSRVMGTQASKHDQLLPDVAGHRWPPGVGACHATGHDRGTLRWVQSLLCCDVRYVVANTGILQRTWRDKVWARYVHANIRREIARPWCKLDVERSSDTYYTLLDDEKSFLKTSAIGYEQLRLY